MSSLEVTPWAVGPRDQGQMPLLVGDPRWRRTEH